MLRAALAGFRGGESILGQASGEPTFYCVECRVPHFPESAEVRAKIAADPPYAGLERVVDG
jgi:hypothetical protein